VVPAAATFSDPLSRVKRRPVFAFSRPGPVAAGIASLYRRITERRAAVALTAGVTDELQDALTSFTARQGLPGAAAGVLVSGELAWSGGAGFADLGTRQGPGAGTLFRIASITKTFTGTAVMQLCTAGRLNLDDPAVTHLPELREAGSPFGPIEALTVRRMLSHESGLRGEPDGTDWSVPAYEGAAERTLGRAAQIAVMVPPHSQHKYSNLAYQLLGEIVARVSGVPYPQYIRDEILHPLGLASTSLEPLAPELAARRASGYFRQPYTDGFQPAPVMPPVGAEGGLWSCVSDLGRWLSAQLQAYAGADAPGGAGAPGGAFGQDGDGGAGAPVLAAAALRDMHKPRYLADDAWTQAWGISWYAVRRDDTVWIQHSGDLPGFSSNACFHPGDRAGAVVLLNGAGDAAGLAMHLAAIARKATRPVAPAAGPVPLPAAFAPLVGSYALPEVGAFWRLEWRDGKLTFTAPGAEGPMPALAPTGDPDRFMVEPGTRGAGEPAVFRRAADGRVVSVRLPTATLPRLDYVAPDGLA
jgi:CubicO group peptidase (beta-lactamase class C family)